MHFLTIQEAQNALSLAKALIALAERGEAVTLSPDDVELVVLGLHVIVLVSPHAPHFPEVRPGHS